MSWSSSTKATPTGREISFDPEEIIVSKTDRQGRITYANGVFFRVSGYTEAEIIGQPHSIVRHPDMPRSVFRLLWETIESGREIFAYVVNLAKNGDHYWVLAHVTPTFGPSGEIVGYHSNRRTPDRVALEEVKHIYQAMRAEEMKHASKAEQLTYGTQVLTDTLARTGKPYDELMFSLGDSGR